MWNVSRSGFFNLPKYLIQSKRFRNINIQKPRKPHFERAKYIELTKPIFPSRYRDKVPIELCGKVLKKEKPEVDNPFQRIIAGELLRWFQGSRLVAFFHMNPMEWDDEFKAFAQFKKQGMHYKKYGKKTMEMAIKDTPYEVILQFYCSQNMTVFSPEPKIKEMLKVAKRFPQLILLAAVFEGKFISKDKLMEYSLIPDLPSAQAGLVHTLNSIGGQVVGQLTTHQTGLVSHLQERIKQLEEE